MHLYPDEPSRPALSAFIDRIERLQATVAQWNEPDRRTVQALCDAIDVLHREALTRLIEGVKSEPEAAAALRRVAGDEVVYAVLRHFNLVKPSLQERVDQALASVRPLLQEHGGNVELLRMDPPDTIEIALVGACDGCAGAEVTLTNGVEQAIKEHCPEITIIKKAKGRVPPAPVPLVAPFSARPDANWHYALELDAMPNHGVAVIELAGQSLLLTRHEGTVSCFLNACAHMGLPLGRGLVADGVLTCPHHGFRYELGSGTSLTAPDVRLEPRPVRVAGSKVEVQVSR